MFFTARARERMIAALRKECCACADKHQEREDLEILVISHICYIIIIIDN